MRGWTRGGGRVTYVRDLVLLFIHMGYIDVLQRINWGRGALGPASERGGQETRIIWKSSNSYILFLSFLLQLL